MEGREATATVAAVAAVAAAAEAVLAADAGTAAVEEECREAEAEWWLTADSVGAGVAAVTASAFVIDDDSAASDACASASCCSAACCSRCSVFGVGGFEDDDDEAAGTAAAVAAAVADAAGASASAGTAPDDDRAGEAAPLLRLALCMVVPSGSCDCACCVCVCSLALTLLVLTVALPSLFFSFLLRKGVDDRTALMCAAGLHSTRRSDPTPEGTVVQQQQSRWRGTATWSSRLQRTAAETVHEGWNRWRDSMSTPRPSKHEGTSVILVAH